MTFLPVAERELRVAARKRSTPWIRASSALVALLIGAGFMILAVFGGVANSGNALFSTLTWMAFVVALSAGLFLTSDCLSEEKRDGTLGLLFLTDLRGYDVVLGKLLASSLRGFFALLAIFPVLAIPILMGGVTGENFWKGALALVQTILLSLGAGVFASAVSRSSNKAMALTLGIMVVIVAGGPILDAILEFFWPHTVPLATLVSPGFLLATADEFVGGDFWKASLACFGLTGLFFGGASLLLPRMWQDTPRRAANPSPSMAPARAPSGAVLASSRRRARLLDQNPVLWAMTRERWPGILMWCLAALFVAGLAMAALITATFGQWPDGIAFVISSQVGALFVYMTYFQASQSGRFFVEAKRSGVLELLLSTPLTVREILQGQWRGWLRLIGLPIAVIILCQGVITLATRWSFDFPGQSSAAPLFVIASSLSMMVISLFNVAALFWFGLWTGLTSKRLAMSSLMTLVFVQIIPSIVIGFASLFVLPLSFAFGLNWFSSLLSTVVVLLYLTKDVAFVVWSRRRLLSELRLRAAGLTGKARSVAGAVPPPIPNGQ